MRPTLEHLPHEILGLPVFGVGWVLLIIAGVIGVGLWMGGSTRKATLQSLPLALIVAAVVVWLLPRLEETYVASDGTTTQGIPLRGYGLMLFIATITAVWLAQHRARQRGLDAEVVYSLATWVIATGLLGGRIFYVGQYWRDFQMDTRWATAREMLNFAQGGLVVYGALIGAAMGFLIFARRHQIPLLFLADMAAPSMVLGLAIGRLGCLLNGCCFGGLCVQPWAIEFPAPSPAYEHQLATGTIHGFQWRLNSDRELLVKAVVEGSAADRAGLRPGDVLTAINSRPVSEMPEQRNVRLLLSVSPADAKIPAIGLTVADGRHVTLEARMRPERSQPVHPTQIYSTINAGLVLLLLLFAEPFLPRTGQLTALMLTIYPTTRFLLEMIRRDEAAFGPTSMTISQNISVLLLLVAVAIWAYVSRLPQGVLIARRPSSPPTAPA